MDIGKFKKGEYLPNPLSAVEVYPNEFNVPEVINRSNYRLLENDIFLYQNFLSLSGESDFCNIFRELETLVVSNSAEWNEKIPLLSGFLWTDYTTITDPTKTYYPLLYKYERKLSGPNTYALSFRDSTISTTFNDNDIPTSKAVRGMIAQMVGPEVPWQRTYSDGSHRDITPGNVGVWYLDKIM